MKAEPGCAVVLRKLSGRQDVCRVLDRHLAMLECSWPSICARSKPPAQPNSEQLIKGSHILLLDFAGTQNQIGRVVLLPRSNASTCHARCHSRPVRYTNVHTGSVSMATRTTTDAHPRENCIAADTACIVWTTNSKSARARVEVAADSPSSRTRFPFPPPSPPPPPAPLPAFSLALYPPGGAPARLAGRR